MDAFLFFIFKTLFQPAGTYFPGAWNIRPSRLEHTSQAPGTMFVPDRKERMSGLINILFCYLSKNEYLWLHSAGASDPSICLIEMQISPFDAVFAKNKPDINQYNNIHHED